MIFTNKKTGDVRKLVKEGNAIRRRISAAFAVFREPPPFNLNWSTELGGLLSMILFPYGPSASITLNLLAHPPLLD